MPNFKLFSLANAYLRVSLTVFSEILFIRLVMQKQLRLIRVPVVIKRFLLLIGLILSSNPSCLLRRES